MLQEFRAEEIVWKVQEFLFPNSDSIAIPGSCKLDKDKFKEIRFLSVCRLCFKNHQKNRDILGSLYKSKISGNCGDCADGLVEQVRLEEDDI